MLKQQRLSVMEKGLVGVCTITINSKGCDYALGWVQAPRDSRLLPSLCQHSRWPCCRRSSIGRSVRSYYSHQARSCEVMNAR